jgi:hypothetical protein
MNCPHRRQGECGDCRRKREDTFELVADCVRVVLEMTACKHPRERRSVNGWCGDCGARVSPSVIFENVQGAIAAGIVDRAKRFGIDLRAVSEGLRQGQAIGDSDEKITH